MPVILIYTPTPQRHQARKSGITCSAGRCFTVFRLLTPPFTKNNSPGMRKTACKGRGGLPAVWCVLRWVVRRCTGGRPVAAYAVGVGCGFVFVIFRLIPLKRNSTERFYFPLKRYGFRQDNHGGTCSPHPAKTRHSPE